MLRSSGVGSIKINTEDMDSGPTSSNQYDQFVSDMAKTSMFGGEINSAQLPVSPAG